MICRTNGLDHTNQKLQSLWTKIINGNPNCNSHKTSLNENLKDHLHNYIGMKKKNKVFKVVV